MIFFVFSIDSDVAQTVDTQVFFYHFDDCTFIFVLCTMVTIYKTRLLSMGINCTFLSALLYLWKFQVAVTMYKIRLSTCPDFKTLYLKTVGCLGCLCFCLLVCICFVDLLFVFVFLLVRTCFANFSRAPSPPPPSF